MIMSHTLSEDVSMAPPAQKTPAGTAYVGPVGRQTSNPASRQPTIAYLNYMARGCTILARKAIQTDEAEGGVELTEAVYPQLGRVRLGSPAMSATSFRALQGATGYVCHDQGFRTGRAAFIHDVVCVAGNRYRNGRLQYST